MPVGDSHDGAYRQRRDVLVEALARDLPDARVTGVAAGLHALVELPAGIEEADAVARARARGIGLVSLAELRAGDARAAPALLLSYAASSEAEIQRGVRELAYAIGDVEARAS